MLVWICLRILSWISRRYDRVTGRHEMPRQPAPWLLSMSATNARPARPDREINAVEMIVISIVVFAVCAFEAWFFFFAKAVVPG